MNLIEMIIFIVLVFSASAFFWYLHFHKKETILLDTLRKMVDNAKNGTLQREQISEAKLSALEDELKHYLDNCALATKNQEKQRIVTQSLISDISHQTLTPISNVKIYSELLSEKAGEYLEEVETIREQTEKLDFLIQSLVKLSRLESGIIKVQIRNAEIHELLCAMEQTYGAKAREKKIKLEIVDTEIKAKFDPKWTMEALGNIVENALKYTESGGTVRISVTAYTMFVKIDVKDSGIGISDEEINRIFTRFYRGVNVNEESGVGIGLYLAREIMQTQRGYIRVSSQESIGSVFSVFLPMV